MLGFSLSLCFLASYFSLKLCREWKQHYSVSSHVFGLSFCWTHSQVVLVFKKGKISTSMTYYLKINLGLYVNKYITCYFASIRVVYIHATSMHKWYLILECLKWVFNNDLHLLMILTRHKKGNVIVSYLFTLSLYLVCVFATKKGRTRKVYPFVIMWLIWYRRQCIRDLKKT